MTTETRWSGELQTVYRLRHAGRRLACTRSKRVTFWFGRPDRICCLRATRRSKVCRSPRSS